MPGESSFPSSRKYQYAATSPSPVRFSRTAGFFPNRPHRQTRSSSSGAPSWSISHQSRLCTFCPAAERQISLPSETARSVFLCRLSCSRAFLRRTETVCLLPDDPARQETGPAARGAGLRRRQPPALEAGAIFSPLHPIALRPPRLLRRFILMEAPVRRHPFADHLPPFTVCQPRGQRLAKLIEIIHNAGGNAERSVHRHDHIDLRRAAVRSL